MPIELRLFATLSDKTPKDSQAFPILPGETIRALMKRLEVDENEVKLIFVNGRAAPAEHVLAEGDRVGLFPPIGGG